MDHWFPADLIHRHEHFGHGTDGILNVYGNKAIENDFRRFREEAGLLADGRVQSGHDGNGIALSANDFCAKMQKL